MKQSSAVLGRSNLTAPHSGDSNTRKARHFQHSRDVERFRLSSCFRCELAVAQAAAPAISVVNILLFILASIDHNHRRPAD
jgi:hypothetical protein